MALTITRRVPYNVGLHRPASVSASRCGWHGISRPNEPCDNLPVESVEVRDAKGRRNWYSACTRATYQIADLPHER